MLILDCDEFLTKLDMEGVCAAIEAHPHGVGQICRHSYTGSEIGGNASTEEIDRVFNRRKYHYIYKIHEQVADRKATPRITSAIPFP